MNLVMTAPPRAIVPVLLIIATAAGALFLYLDSLGEKAAAKPWRWGDAPLRPARAAMVRLVAGMAIFFVIVTVAGVLGAYDGARDRGTAARYAGSCAFALGTGGPSAAPSQTRRCGNRSGAHQHAGK